MRPLGASPEATALAMMGIAGAGRNSPVPENNRKGVGKKDLQTSGIGRKSRKSPTPLNLASKHGRKEVKELLIMAGAK